MAAITFEPSGRDVQGYDQPQAETKAPSKISEVVMITIVSQEGYTVQISRSLACARFKKITFPDDQAIFKAEVPYHIIRKLKKVAQGKEVMPERSSQTEELYLYAQEVGFIETPKIVKKSKNSLQQSREHFYSAFINRLPDDLKIALKADYTINSDLDWKSKFRLGLFIITLPHVLSSNQKIQTLFTTIFIEKQRLLFYHLLETFTSCHHKTIENLELYMNQAEEDPELRELLNGEVSGLYNKLGLEFKRKFERNKTNGELYKDIINSSNPRDRLIFAGSIFIFSNSPCIMTTDQDYEVPILNELKELFLEEEKAEFQKMSTLKNLPFLPQDWPHARNINATNEEELLLELLNKNDFALNCSLFSYAWVANNHQEALQNIFSQIFDEFQLNAITEAHNMMSLDTETNVTLLHEKPELLDMSNQLYECKCVHPSFRNSTLLQAIRFIVASESRSMYV